MDGTQQGTHPEPETQQQGPGTWLPVKQASGSACREMGDGGGTVALEKEREGYCRYRSHDPPGWALHGAEEVRQEGGATLMGLPWASTDTCNFPLPSHLPLYLGDKDGGVTPRPPPPFLYRSPPALLLPQPPMGLLQSY